MTHQLPFFASLLPAEKAAISGQIETLLIFLFSTACGGRWP
jgi:hypothetical protein